MAYQGSTFKVNKLEGTNNNPVILGFGATIPSGAYLTANGGLSVTGVITAGGYSGDGSSLTAVSAASTAFVIGFSYLGV